MAPIAPGEHDGPASRWDGALPTHMSHNDQVSQTPPLVPPPPPTTPPPTTPPPPAPQQRRLSMEEDYLYQEVINTTSCQLSQRRESLLRRSGVPGAVGPLWQLQDAPPEYENLPPYSCSVHIEAVFMKKLEVENATKRAEDRRWHPVYAILHGTALNVYQVKKDWGWGKKTDTSRTGAQAQPDPGGGIGMMNLEPNKSSEDNPLGVKAGKLQKSYGLLHADVGIAADYRKRRYVIRVRAESDQFLLSCLELETFVRWLDALFAAIDIAAPIDDRDFPRDQSIPRIQRLRWLRGEGGALRPGDRPHPAAAYAAEAATVSSSERPRVRTVTERGSGGSHSTANALARAAGVERRGIIINANGQIVEDRRLSRDSRTSTVINFTADGKWSPRHAWTRRHDMLYAKLCYSTLLFRSPRKSNYVIMQGDQWYVDWPTGRMVRVQPPTYSENMAGGPFFTAHVGHTRI